MEYSGAGGKLMHEKNQKQKISWHCPFKLFWDPFERHWWFCSICPSIRSWLIQSPDRTPSLWTYPSFQFLILIPKLRNFSALYIGHIGLTVYRYLSSAESITVVKGSLARDFRLLVFHESVSPGSLSIPSVPFQIFKTIAGYICNLTLAISCSVFSAM